MGFKMNGSPAKTGSISGTSGHSSALKMKAEANAAEAASSPAKYYPIVARGLSLLPKVKNVAKVVSKAPKGTPGFFGNTASKSSKWLSRAKTIGKHTVGYMALDKAIDWISGGDDKKTTTPPATKPKKKSGPNPYARAKKNDPNLDSYIAGRKKHKKGSAEYNAFQNKINKAYGVKKRHGVTNVSTTSTKGVFGGKDVKTTTRNTPGISDFQAETVTSRGGKKKVTTKRYEDDKGVTTKKHKSKYRKSGVEKKRKSVYKTDWDKDSKVDKKTRVKVKKDASGNVKRKKVVSKEGGVRTVTKTNRKGETKTRSRKTLNPFD
jgi:hypothetical protein